MYLALFKDPPRGTDFWTSGYSQIARLPREELKRLHSLSPLHLFAANQLPREGRILDAGCGLGILSIMNPHPSNEIVGVDRSPDLVRMARQLSPGSEFREGSLLSLPFPSESFDLYVALSSVELIPEGLESSLSEGLRVLKKGGRLIAACKRLQPDFFLVRPKEIESTTGRLRLEKVSEPPVPPPPDFFGFYYSRRELKNAIKLAGFTDIKTSRSDFLGGLSYSSLLGRYVREAVFKRLHGTGEKGFLWRHLIRETFPLSPLIALLHPLWSFWNVLVARK